MKSQLSQTENVQLATAKANDLPISTKHSVEISRNLRYHSTSYAKQFLEGVASLRRAVPFKRFNKDRGHKAGMAAGQFPQKAAKEFLKLLHTVEANAQHKGLDAGNLKIVKILANKASIPFTGSRLRRKTKRTHLEVVVQDMGGKKQTDKKKEEKIAQEKEEKKIPEQKTVETHKKELPNKEHHEIKAENKLELKEELKQQHSPSSEHLLQQAQMRAADLKKKESEKQESEKVAHLVEELQKKGTLRTQNSKPRGAK